MENQCKKCGKTGAFKVYQFAYCKDCILEVYKRLRFLIGMNKVQKQENLMPEI